MRPRTVTLTVAVLVVVAIAALAFQASAKTRSNPPVVSEPAWDSPETRALASRACFDCHSNETRWPIYSGLPVIGGMIADHVDEGRSHLNLSEWGVPGRRQEDGSEAAEKVFDPMHYAEDDGFWQPPYGLLHPSARLTDAERAQLAEGLRASLGGGGERGGADRDGDDD